MVDMHYIEHTLEPWYDSDSEVLILGTIPSPKSREYHCYYGHPQNRFWKTLSVVFDDTYPQDVKDRQEFIKRHRIALWDVLASCKIRGAEDASIAQPKPNDIEWLLSNTKIHTIYTTGTKAKKLYDRLVYPKTMIKANALPSTSPANRRWFSEEDLIEAYRTIRMSITTI